MLDDFIGLHDIHLQIPMYIYYKQFRPEASEPQYLFCTYLSSRSKGIGDVVLYSLPRRPRRHSFPPSSNIGIFPGLENIHARGGEQGTEWEVEEVGEGDLIACEIQLIRENSFVSVKGSLQTLDRLLNRSLVRLLLVQRCPNSLRYNHIHIGVEVRELDTRSLLEPGELFLAPCGKGGDQARAGLGSKIPRDGATFEQLESVVFDNERDLAEGVVLDMSIALVFFACEVDGDKLVGEVELVKDDSEAFGVGGEGNSDNFENHLYWFICFAWVVDEHSGVTN